RGTLSSLRNIPQGAVGLPVFAGFSGGLGSLFGSAGGYIIGFLGSALVMWAMEKLLGTGAVAQIASMVVGLLVCYAFGTVWFMVVYTTANGAVTLLTVLGWCVFPFIVPDLAKIALAFLMTNRLKRYVPQ
ncbi:MAG: biotin transporter BioY, partial [Clostridiales bacterium]|nr:biotin transporter BioY [Clostridiales bacterium]